MIDLTDPNLIKHYDKSHQLSIMDNWSIFCREAYNSAKNVTIPPKVSLNSKTISYHRPSTIVIAGMGGSAIAGEYLSALLAPQAPIPIITNRDYYLPSFVNEDTLVICISYSGNTEETLSMLYHALKRNSMVVSISSGGYLETIAKVKGFPHINIKSGLMPRASLPLIYISVLTILEHFGIIDDLATSVIETADILNNLQQNLSASSSTNNLAKELAIQLNNSFPITVGYGLYAPVAYRAKCQFNENSKIIALAELIPEQNHNSIVAFDHPNPTFLSQTSYILLRDKELESVSIKLRFKMLKNFIASLGIKSFELTPSGSSALSRQLSVTYIIDYISIYLGVLYGLDPSETLSISKLKSTLEKEKPIKDELFNKILEV